MRKVKDMECLKLKCLVQVDLGSLVVTSNKVAQNIPSHHVTVYRAQGQPIILSIHKGHHTKYNNFQF